MVVISRCASRRASPLLPTQAGARIGARKAVSATSRRVTSMDSIVDLGTSIGTLESGTPRRGPRTHTPVPVERRLERDVVVRGRSAAVGVVRRPGIPWSHAALTAAAATPPALAATASAATAPAQEDDAVRHDVRRVVFLPVLVVRTGLQPALDVDRPALGQVLVAVLGRVAPHRHAVPLRLLLALARLVLEDLGRRDAEIAEGAARRRVLELRIR